MDIPRLRHGRSVQGADSRIQGLKRTRNRVGGHESHRKPLKSFDSRMEMARFAVRFACANVAETPEIAAKTGVERRKTAQKRAQT